MTVSPHLLALPYPNNNNTFWNTLELCFRLSGPFDNCPTLTLSMCFSSKPVAQEPPGLSQNEN